MIPKPLQKLYDRASLFLDKDSTHQDHYWAVGIHRALHEVYGGEIHTAPANIAKEKVAMSRLSRKGVARPVKSPRLHETFEEACARRRRITESFRKEHPEHKQPFLRPEEAVQLEAPKEVLPPTLPDEAQAA